MRIPPKLVGAAAAVAGVLAGAAPAVASPAEPPATATPAYWDNQCNPGRACIAQYNAGKFWNLESCGWNYVHDYYDYAVASGNPFTVFYQDNRWDAVDRWASRGLDPGNLVTRVYVSC